MAKKPVAKANLLFPDMAGTVTDGARSYGQDEALQKYLLRVDQLAKAWTPRLTKNRTRYLLGRGQRR